MMKKLLFVFAVLTIAGCKKDYTCTCTDPTLGVVATETIKDTKGKAGEQCTSYYNQHYGTIPFNQTTCSLN